ncbi:MAG: 16S rRNA (cytosine(1402)-N(4))-methyltransferase RsmH [Actinomycetes bacterium]
MATPESKTPSDHRHVPVMVDRLVALLGPALEQPGSVLVDATLGLGGHSEAFLRRFPSLRLVGIDRDREALKASSGRLAGFADRVTFVHAVYDELPAVLERLGLVGVQAVLFDLGVSSLQLDAGERGFAYSVDAPLDMRMDQSSGLTAAEVLNSYDVNALTDVLRRYGEERFARKIARAVVREREAQPFTSSQRLVELLRREIPAAARRTGGHPAKRTFQALRIEVNGELAAWESALPEAVAALALHGRVAVLSYHSLEDRITTHCLASLATDTTPRGLPVVVEGHGPELRLITRGAERPTLREVSENPRAASAMLRAAERVRVAA